MIQPLQPIAPVRSYPAVGHQASSAVYRGDWDEGYTLKDIGVLTVLAVPHVSSKTGVGGCGTPGCPGTVPYAGVDIPRKAGTETTARAMAVATVYAVT